MYGLVGIGYSVLYNASGIINFAQGAFVMLGGMITYVLFTLLGIPLPLAILGAIVCVGLLGYAIELSVIRPLRQRNASIFIMILATLACQILIENATLHLVDDKPHSFPYFTPGAPVKIFGAAVGLQDFWIIGISLLLAESNLTSAAAIADRLYVIDRGEITFHGTPSEALASESVMRTLRG